MVDVEDPFIEFMRPPQGETPSQAMARQARLEHEQRENDRIEEEIKQERSLARRERNVIRVLLLGQAESGKSTTLKNFRMQYDRAAWEKERSGWRAIVQLNIVRAITTIISVLEAELSRSEFKLTDGHQLLMIRLAPLRSLERDLQRRLGSGAEEIRPNLPMSATPFETPTIDANIRKKVKEFSVRCWRDVVDPETRTAQPVEDDGASTRVLAQCKDDMKALVEDPLVWAAMDRRQVLLPDCAMFFLRDLDRLATRDYVASDDDIVRARLRTVGIQEYRLRLKANLWEGQLTDGAWEWRIYDVGGCRTARAAWVPFFENTNAIIFLCPLSCFDEKLEEDPRVNRLEDCLILWKSICSAQLLAKSQLILFMNKCDLLNAKLKRVRLNKYVPSYGDRPNETTAVAKYFQGKFRDVMKKCSPQPRPAYCHLTTVTDTNATAKTLESVRDGVLRTNLGDSQLI